MKILSILAALALAAVPLVAADTIGGSSAILLGVDSVQKELKLNSLQKAVLNDIRNEYRDACRDITAKVAAGKESKKDGLASLQALTVGSDRRALHVLNDDQRTRLEEIRTQILGTYLLFSPALQAKLGLTEKQKAQVAKIAARSDKTVDKVNAAFEAGKITYYERITKLRANRFDCRNELLRVLTAEQYGEFSKLEGEAFTI